MQNKPQKIFERSFLEVILFIGLLLSQTHLLLRIADFAPSYHAPSVTFLYFLISTLFLAVSMLFYGVYFRHQLAPILQLYEHIIIPFSALLLRLLISDSHTQTLEIICALLLVAQSLLVAIKIVYFGSIAKQLAQYQCLNNRISTLTKLSRLIKLNLMAILPIFISSQIVLTVIVSSWQLLSVIVSFLRFTYQRCRMEYILLICVLCGILSALENIVQTVLGLSYLFLGEIFAIVLFIILPSSLVLLLQLKYTHSFSQPNQTKAEDDFLAEMLITRECLFEQYTSLNFSQQTKNEAVLAMMDLMQKVKGVNRQERQENSEQSPLLWNKIKIGDRGLSQTFFELALYRFRQTSSFSSFVFMVENALDLKCRFTSFALVLYYRFCQKTRAKSSTAESCQYQQIYQMIRRNLNDSVQDPHQIRFIAFSENLKTLNAKVGESFEKQVQIIEYLINDEKKQLFIDERLLSRHKIKEQIRKTLKQCFSNELYLNSSEFKYLYLLFKVTIEKRFEALKIQIKKRFFSVQSNSGQHNFRISDDFPFLIVLKGFGNGEIVNSNESFKNHFKISINSFTKRTISELFPSDKQKSKHLTLMTESCDSTTEKQENHGSYECFLAVQHEFQGLKCKIMQIFTIETRIYYENKGSFNYICQLTLRPSKGKEGLFLMQTKEISSMQKKGVSPTIYSKQHFVQLQDKFEAFWIEDNVRRDSFDCLQKMEERKECLLNPQIHKATVEHYLEQKVLLIERKMMEESNQSGGMLLTKWNVLQVCVFLFFGILTSMLIMIIKSNVDELQYAAITQKFHVLEASISKNNIYLQHEILNLINKTQLFPDNLCKTFGISSLAHFFQSNLQNYAENSFDALVSLQVSPKGTNLIDNYLYQQLYDTYPFLVSFNGTVTMQKFITLLKGHILIFLRDMRNGKLPPIDYNEFSIIIPTLLLNSSFDSQNSVFAMIDQITDIQAGNIIALIGRYQIVICLIVLVVIIVSLVLRIKDTADILEYISATNHIPGSFLDFRLKQIQFGLNQFERLKANQVLQVDITIFFQITVRDDKRINEQKNIGNLILMQDIQTIQKEFGESNKQNQPLLNSEVVYAQQIQERSVLVRSLMFNKWYLLVVLVLIAIIWFVIYSLANFYIKKLQLFENYDFLTKNLAHLKQSYINLVAYNWFHSVILNTNMNMDVLEQLYADFMTTLTELNIFDTILNIFPREQANKILYQNICEYFLDPTYCSTYRNGVFKSGLSILIPFTLKQSIELKQVSNSYIDYIPHLCDKTYLLFHGVIPITTKIPLMAFQAFQQNTAHSFVSYSVAIGLLIVLLVLVVLIWQYYRKIVEKAIIGQVLSLDTVKKLYPLGDFKPFFNKIYYA